MKSLLLDVESPLAWVKKVAEELVRSFTYSRNGCNFKSIQVN